MTIKEKKSESVCVLDGTCKKLELWWKRITSTSIGLWLPHAASGHNSSVREASGIILVRKPGIQELIELEHTTATA